MTERDRQGRGEGTMEQVGKAVGEAAGRAADKAAELAAGLARPLVRNAADVLGGWWAGDSAREAAATWDEERDRKAREHYRKQTGGSGGVGGTGPAGGRSYEQARPYYQLGHTASRNPDYSSRSFDQVEPELRRVWAEGGAGGEGDWPEARGFVEFGYGEGGRDQNG